MADKAMQYVESSRKALVDQIIAQMEQGTLIWQRPWDISFFMPHNPVSCVTYSGGNRLRLMLTMMENHYDDPRFVTFLQAKEHGWRIKKGSKGYLCEKWIFVKLMEQENPDTGEMEKVAVELTRPIVSYFYVYNAAQIEGMPERDALPQTVTTEEEDRIVDNLIRASPCEIREELQGRAFYSPVLDCITLPPRDYFPERTGFIKTLCHEMIHSTGHPSRLNREIINEFGTPDYAKEELRAEFGSLFLTADLGLPANGKHLENHAAYLQSWLQCLRDNPNELFAAASDAEQAAQFVMDRYRQITEITGPERKEEPAALAR